MMYNHFQKNTRSTFPCPFVQEFTELEAVQKFVHTIFLTQPGPGTPDGMGEGEMMSACSITPAEPKGTTDSLHRLIYLS